MADEKVGIDSAVNTDTTGTPPNGPTRQLMIGQDVVFKERVATQAQGQTQILFLDESSMSIGPNSDMVIDEYVYDPHAETGKLAMSATRGVFRYVGGQVSKLEGAVTLQTPSVSLGIRGGAFLLELDHGVVNIVFVYGKDMGVSGVSGCHPQFVSRPGYAVSVGGNGCPSEPYPAPPELIARIMAKLDGRPGGNGGARVVPTDQRIVLSGIGNVISANFESNLLSALRAAGFSCQGVSGIQAVAGRVTARCKHHGDDSPYDPGEVQTTLSVNSVAHPSTQTRVQHQHTAVPTPTPAPTPTPTPTPTPGAYSGSFNSVGALIATGFATGPTTFVGGSLTNGVFTVTSNGSTFTLSGFTPGSQTNISGQAPFGAVSGTGFLTGDSSFFYASLATTDGTQVALIEGGMPITSPTTTIGTANQVLAFNVQPDPSLGTNIPFIRNATGGNIAASSISPLFIVTPSGNLAQDPAGLTTSRALQASLAISGSNFNQQSVLVANIGIIGASGGAPQFIGALRGTSLMSANGSPLLITSPVTSIADGVGGGLYGASGLSGFTLASSGSTSASEVPISLRATTYNFNQPAVATPLPAGIGPGLGTNPSPSFVPSTGFFGGFMNSTGIPPYPITGNVAFNQTGPTTFNATFTSTLLPLGSQSTNGLQSLVLTFGGTPSATPNSTIIDGNIYGATEGARAATLTDSTNASVPGAQQLYLLSSAAAPLPNSFLAGGSLCATCAFAQWGYWGGDVVSTFNGGTRVDLGHLNFWVAGQQFPTTSMPTSGIGNYSGSAIGSVNNNGLQYTATGTFTLPYNFASFEVSPFSLNFDGQNFAANVSSNGIGYTGGFIGGGTMGTVNGLFFGPKNAAPNTMPLETGGNFFVQTLAGPYSAAGVFLGHR